MPAQMLDSFARFRIGDMHHDVSRERSDFVQLCGEIQAEIRFRQDDRRRRAAFARHHEVALETTQVVIAVEAHDDEHDVHVCGDDLLTGRLAGGSPCKGAASRQHFHDDAAIFFRALANDDPVADRWQLGAAARAVLQPSGGDRVDFVLVKVDAKYLVELDADAPRPYVGFRLPRFVRGREGLVPPEFRERH